MSGWEALGRSLAVLVVTSTMMLAVGVTILAISEWSIGRRRNREPKR